MTGLFRYFSTIAISTGILLTAITANAASTDSQQTIADRFSQYRGQVVLVDFWASWCGPCRRSFPWMNAMQDKYVDQNFNVIAINLDNERTAADQFLESYPANFTVWYDPEGELAQAFAVSAMPTSFILDENGHIQSVHRGFLTKNTNRYEASIATLIAANQATRNAN